MSCNSTSAPRPFRSMGPFTPTARMMSLLRRSIFTSPPMFWNPPSGVVRDDFDVAGDIGGHRNRPGVREGLDRGRASRHRDFHLIGDALVAGDMILIGADG